MGTEIRTIRLCREPMKENLTGKTCFFSTDYFDFLIAEEKKLDDTFCSIMNLKSNISNGELTSAQSYTLYFSEKMYQKYESNKICAHKGSPFEVGKELNFLSIIQVHITPEALRKMQYVDERLCETEKGIVLEEFIDDLYAILDGFCRDYGRDKFVFRIYQVLSAGDFAVAVKSRYPETSFEISSRIRSRVAGIKEKDGKIQASQWALYKTYTLLTMEQHLNNIEEILNTQRKKGSFVIRGCYSCHYWACQKEIQQSLKEQSVKLPENMSGLNGRYDFSIELREESFYRIYEGIINYKDKSMPAKDDKWKEFETPEEKYLVFLLQKDCMSYINERYLLPVADNEQREATYNNTVSEFVLLGEGRERLISLFEENGEYICKLTEKYQKLSGSSKDILAMHQNARQYFRLLEKHIMSCYVLNQQPDTRAFVPGIGEQLDTVLDSMDVYCRLYVAARASTKIQIADLVVDYMREAVHAIDNYMEHIRNNNLQSLQTPNYNIESNMGMEKILIGYSEYVRKFIEYYQKKMEEEKEFFPIVVPDLHKPDICVEVLFPEGNGDTWEEENKIRKNDQQYNKYLLIIDSPTLSELGDLPVFMAMLFHEIAHQFRYESRKNRNVTLANIIVNESMAELAVGIISEVCGNIDESKVEFELRDMLSRVLTKTVLSWMDKYQYLEEGMETSLYYFKRAFCNRFYSFIQAWNGELDIQSKGAQYIKELWYMAENGCICQEYLKLFHEAITQKAYDVSGIEKAAFALAWRSAYEKLGDNRIAMDSRNLWLLNIEKVKKWCTNDTEDKFGELWYPIFFDADTEQQKAVEEISNSFQSFAIWLEDNRNRLQGTATGLYQDVKEFATMLYTEMCKEWRNKQREFNNIGFAACSDNQNQKRINAYRSWTLAGRYLGIDKTGNEGRFWRIVCSHINDIKWNDMENAVSKYREITSDIFMCGIMGLSPFEYLKLVTMIISEGDLTRSFDIERIVTVIYVMETTGLQTQDENEALKIYWKSCRQILTELECYYRTMFAANADIAVLEEFCRLRENWDEQIKTKRYISMKALAEKLGQMKEKADNDEESMQILRHIENLAKILRRIFLDGPYYITLLRCLPERLHDYQTGVRKLKRICDDMSQTSNPFIKDLSELCSLSKDYIRTKHYQTGVVKDAALNEKSIEFLLGLYYSRKIRNARNDSLQGEEI